jgi:hypothetical protein
MSSEQFRAGRTYFNRLNRGRNLQHGCPDTLFAIFGGSASNIADIYAVPLSDAGSWHATLPSQRVAHRCVLIVSLVAVIGNVRYRPKRVKKIGPGDRNLGVLECGSFCARCVEGAVGRPWLKLWANLAK